MAAKEAKITSSEDIDCPICLEQFKVPTSLPCLHTFCLKCLNSHITENVTKARDVDKFSCPVCRQEIRIPEPGVQSSEWAKSFPLNNFIASLLPDPQSKVPLNCDSCAYEGTTNQASGFCFVCKEYLCDECVKFHRKTKALREHKILDVEELSQSSHIADYLPHKGMCPVHVEEEMKFFCKDHNGLFCSSCTLVNHRACKDVFDLKLHFKELLEMFKPSTMVSKLNSLVTQLHEVTKEKETNLERLKFQVDHLTDEIQDLRQKMNTLFDEMETEVRAEGNRIYKEVSMTLLEQNQQCQSLVAAIQNSKRLLDTVCEHGSQTQVISIMLKMEEQMEHYTKTMDQYKTENTETEVKLELDSHIKTVGEMKWKDCITVRYAFTQPLHSTRHIDRNELVLVLKISEFSHSGAFSSLYLSGDRFLLADWESKKCCMFSPNFDKISERMLSSSPSSLCKAGDSEFAVTLPMERKIKFFTSDTYMKPTRFIQTRIACCGVAIANNGDLFVTYLSNQYLYAAHLSDMGVEKNSVKLDTVNRMNYGAIIAIDPASTRAYISCCNNDTLYIWPLQHGLDGCSKYQSPQLVGLDYVNMDKNGNVYVVGGTSNNIHQLSPEGALIRIITENIPLSPCAISFNESGDKFILTSTKSQCYVFKKIFEEI